MSIDWSKFDAETRAEESVQKLKEEHSIQLKKIKEFKESTRYNEVKNHIDSEIQRTGSFCMDEYSSEDIITYEEYELFTSDIKVNGTSTEDDDCEYIAIYNDYMVKTFYGQGSFMVIYKTEE